MVGRPHKSLQIADTFLQPHETIAIMPNLITFDGKFNNKLSTLQWLSERRLITNSVNCSHRNELCTFSHCRAQDGYRWQCQGHNYM